MARNLRQRTQNLLERGLVHGTLTRLLLLFLGSFLFILFGTGAIFFGLFDPDNMAVTDFGKNHEGTFWDAFWWSLKHAIDPGTFTGDYGSSLMILIYALVITIGGWAIFGVFVGVISNSIEQHLAKLDKGIGSVVVSDHILILGWNRRAPAVIARLFESWNNPLIVVLANEDVHFMRNELRLSTPVNTKQAHKVTFRQGVVTSEQELRGVSFEHAERIIILANEDSQLDEISRDIASIELVSLFAHTRTWANHKPHIVAEILDDSTREIANLAGDHQIPVLTSTDMTSRIIVQASRQADLSNVLIQLFSTGQSQLVLKQVPECSGMAFIDILNKFEDATPIGVCDVLELEDRTVHIPDINPPADHIIEEQEKIILIAKNDNIVFDKNKDRFETLTSGQGDYDVEESLNKILILGWNSGIYKILEQFIAYLSNDTGMIKVVSSFSDEKANRLVSEKAKSVKGQVKVQCANYLERPIMKALLEEGFDRVVLLSDESKGIKDRDSIIKMALILLQWVFETQNLAKRPHVIAEILDNSGMLSRPPYSQFELISSPDIFSLMLTHFAQENDLRSIATELLNPHGQQVKLKPVARYVQPGQRFTFGQLVRTAKERNEIVWGLVQKNGKASEKEIVINPDPDQQMTLSEDDQIIALSH